MPEIIARSPIRPVQPAVVAGWEVTGRHSSAGLVLTDLTPLAKASVRASFRGAVERALGVPFGRAARDGHGGLVIGSGPGEWLVLSPVGGGRELLCRLEEIAAGAVAQEVVAQEAVAQELVTILDLTHGRALMRLTGTQAAPALAKVCAIDMDDARTPNGAAFRSSVAKVVTDVVRDDSAGSSGPVPSYLLLCDRSYGQYLFGALLDAGGEFGIDVGGFTAPGI